MPENAEGSPGLQPRGYLERKPHARQLLKQLGITNPVDAFIAGSVDAMMFDVAFAIAIQGFAAKTIRAQLLTEFWKSKKKAKR